MAGLWFFVNGLAEDRRCRLCGQL